MSGRSPRAAAAAVGAAALLAAVLALPACGKKGVPQPPVRVLPEAVRGFEVRQRGDRVVLSLLEPKGRTDGSPFVEPVVLRLTRLPEEAADAGATPRRAPRSRRPDSRAMDTVSWVVPRKEWPAYRVERRLEIPIPIESLELAPGAGEPGHVGRRAVFVAEIQEGVRRRSVAAGPVAVTLCAPPPPPRDVRARLTASGISLEWSAAEGAASGVNIYRATGKGAFPGRPSHTLAASDRAFLDESAVPGTDYRYEVRLAGGADPLLCESGAGSAEATYVDIFPPAPPRGLAAAAEESLIRLFWTPNAEPDVAGYLVYRREGPDEPFRLLTPQPITETTYADGAVERGRRYAYVVSAVDTAIPANQSGWSERAEETLP